MLADFVNVKGKCDNCNNQLQKNNDPCPFAEFKDQVERSENNKRYHRYCCGMILQAVFYVALQQAYKASLHAASRALNMQQYFGWARQHMML